MVSFLKSQPHVQILVVEKTDRLYRNFRDAVTLEDLDIEIHFVKEGQVLSKECKVSSEVHARYSPGSSAQLLGKPTRRSEQGYGEKAAQGTYPGRAPFGYRNNKDTRAIEIHTSKSRDCAVHV